MGANVDAVETARTYGIREDRAVRFHNDREGVRLNYCVLEETVAMYRKNGNVQAKWADRIATDYKKRENSKEEN